VLEVFGNIDMDLLEIEIIKGIYVYVNLKNTYWNKKMVLTIT
jgi:hypothetical protein